MKNFKDRVELFWKLFLEEEADLREGLGDKGSFQEARERIEEIIENTFCTRSYEVKLDYSTKKWELMLTPEGDKARLFELKYWKDRAPKELLEHWSFYEMREPVVDEVNCTLEVYDIRVEASDIRIYPSFEESRINLEVYIDGLEDIEDPEAYLMFSIFMQQFIGEAYDMAYIGEVELITEPREEEAIILSELKAYIEKVIEEHQIPIYEDLCEVYTAYELTPNKVRNSPLREDIYKGKSSLMAIIHEYYTNRTGLLEEANQLGITYGFIFFNTEKMSKEGALSLRNRLEDQLIKANREKHLVKYIGDATGLYHNYIDCIVFDMVEFINYLEELLVKYDFEEVGFKVFKPGGKKIFF